MIVISSTVGFWILNAWRRMNSHLQVSGTIDGKPWSLPGEIVWTAPKESKARFAVEELSGDSAQKREWTESLFGATFWFGIPGESDTPVEFSGDAWFSLMRIERSSGESLWLGEIFVDR